MATPRKTAAAKKTAAKRTVPAGARKPQDHQPPKSAEPEKLRVRVRGVEWAVDSESLDDFELLDDLNALEQRSDPTRMPSVLRRLLGDEQWSKAMDVMRSKETGRVTVESGSEFVMELIEALNPNSSSS